MNSSSSSDGSDELKITFEISSMGPKFASTDADAENNVLLDQHGKGNFLKEDLLGEIQNLLNFEVHEYRGGVFLVGESIATLESTIEDWFHSLSGCAESQDDLLGAVESVVNHRHVLLSTDVTMSIRQRLAEFVGEVWRVELERKFPDRKFEVLVEGLRPNEGDDFLCPEEVTISFHSVLG